MNQKSYIISSRRENKKRIKNCTRGKLFSFCDQRETCREENESWEVIVVVQQNFDLFLISRLLYHGWKEN